MADCRFSRLSAWTGRLTWRRCERRQRMINVQVGRRRQQSLRLLKRVEVKECADPLYPFKSRVCLGNLLLSKQKSESIGSFQCVLVVNFDTRMYIYVYMYYRRADDDFSWPRIKPILLLHPPTWLFSILHGVCLRFLTVWSRDVEAGLVEMVIPQAKRGITHRPVAAMFFQRGHTLTPRHLFRVCPLV